MPTLIHLVRHGESEHNVTKDRNQRDPSLTKRGYEQASQLNKSFPRQDQVALVLTSPLRRAIQTAVTGFGTILDKSSPRPEGSSGIEKGARLEMYPDIQPGDDLPSETGSDREILEKEFPGLDFSPLYPSWPSKRDKSDKSAGKETGKRVRRHLATLSKDLEGKERCDIVLVTHGFVKEILSGRDRSDWPRAGWKSYVLKPNGEDDFTLELVDM
jgi:broad specificity phosphatase PhoE